MLFNELRNFKKLKEALDELSPSTEIYVDMDGVLADFFGEWAKLMQVDHFSQINKKHNIDDALQKIRDTEEFWLNLPMLPQARQLLTLIKKVKGSYNICSSPLADDPNSEPHKKEWIKRNLDFFPPKNIYITHNKPAYAKNLDGTPNILIDDYGVNINAWEKAGGIGFKYKDHKFERTAKALQKIVSEDTKKSRRIFKTLSEYELEDRHPNEKPYGPEFKPTMPAGTIRVKVSDVYDWYKLGQHISDLDNLDHNDFGEGPPQAVISFGSEEEEHKYVDLLQKLGLEIIDIDPGPPDAKGVKGSKTYSNESVIKETIRKVGSQYVIYSEKGKRLGSYASRGAAEKRLRQIEYFKHNESIKEGVEIDNKDGWGAVPYNQEVDYRGLRVKMKPSVFINLAASRNGEPPVPKVVDYVKSGGAIGAPFLQIFVDEDDSQIPEVRGHEGRSRMAAILEVHGDVPVEVHLFFQGKVNRNRHITPEFVEKIQRYLISENDKMVRGPLFEI